MTIDEHYQAYQLQLKQALDRRDPNSRQAVAYLPMRKQEESCMSLANQLRKEIAELIDYGVPLGTSSSRASRLREIASQVARLEEGFAPLSFPTQRAEANHWKARARKAEAALNKIDQALLEHVQGV